jgi:hypothetical protein
MLDRLAVSRECLSLYQRRQTKERLRRIMQRSLQLLEFQHV